MVVPTLCQKSNEDSAPSTTEEATTDLLGDPEPPAQDHPRGKGERKKKKLAQHKEYRLKIYQKARKGMRISERAMFHNIDYQMTDLRKLIKTKRRKTVENVQAMFTLQAATIEKTWKI